MSTHDTTWRKTRIAAIAKRTGLSELEIEEILVEQFDLYMSESNIVWDDKRPDDIVLENRQERKNVMLSLHQMHAQVRELTTVAKERANIMASIALAISRKFGIAKLMPEIASDKELQKVIGYIDSAGRLYAATDKPAQQSLVQPPEAPEIGPTQAPDDDETPNLTSIVPPSPPARSR